MGDGSTIETSGVSGERRLVTILFCDLVGSTDLSQRLDQEDYAELVLSYQELLRRIIVEHGGIVANYLGDGVVGQFGYPDAHENDAERAVAAGLEICTAVAELDRTLGAELDVRIECRIGTHASVSVVGTMGTGRSDMSIFGDTANIASRVEGVAESGQIYATKAVIDLLRGEFETTDHKTVELKGVSEPTEVARIVARAATQIEAEPVLHLGRTEILTDLRRRWTDAQNGSGSFVVISGEGGLGKSALVRRLVQHEQPPLVIAKGRALSQGQPFGVLAGLAEATISDARPPVAGRAGRVRELLAQPLDVGASAEARWQAIFEEGLGLLHAMAADPVLVIVEDLHWTDASTIELLERFAKTADDAAVLLLATTRPGPSVGAADTIELGPMEPADLRVLVIASADNELSEEVIGEIVDRAEGVPLFAVELARGASSESGLTIPESLQASLLARLAFLPELSEAAQVASVIGDEIDPVLLHKLLADGIDPAVDGTGDVDELLARLAEAHVVEFEDDGGCQFAHALLREAIYSSMLRRDRRRLHQRIASTLTESGARDDHRLQLVAHHLVLGSRAAEGATCYATASRRTAALGAFADAVELADKGLAALGIDPDPTDALLELTMTKGNAINAAIGYNAEGLFDLWCRAEAVADALENRLEQSSGMNGQSVTALFSGHYETAIERADRILDFADQRDDRVARLRAQCSRSLPQLYMGRVDDAYDNAQIAAALYEPGDYELVTYGFGTDQLCIALTTAATAAFFADAASGAATAEQLGTDAIDHAKAIDSPISIAMSLNQAAMLAIFADENARAIAYVDEVWTICDKFGLPFYRMVSTLSRATALGRQGDPSARDLAYTALFSGDAGGGELGLTLGYYMVALCEEASGGSAAAFDLAAGALDVVAERDERLLEVELLALQMRCRPSLEIAERLTNAIDLAHSRGAHGSADRGQAFV